MLRRFASPFFYFGKTYNLQKIPFAVFLQFGRKSSPARRDGPAGGPFFFGQRVAAMTALMVCIRFSASSKTMEAGLRNT